MRIVKQTMTELHLRKNPWLAWCGAAVMLCVAALFTFEPWMGPALECGSGTCSFREPLRETMTFPARELSGAVLEQDQQRGRLARLILVIRDERVPFDVRYSNHSEVQQQVERVERFVKSPDTDLLLGVHADLNHALALFGAAFIGCLFMALRGRVFSLQFNLGTAELTLRDGSPLSPNKRTLPLSDVHGVAVVKKDAAHALVLQLASGEALEIDEFVMAERADKAEVKAAIVSFLPHR